MKRLNLLALLVVLSLVLTVSDGFAAQVVSTTFQMPVRAQLTLDESGCENAPGPFITLSGALALGGLGSDVIFRNNEKGTHTAIEESVVNAILLPAGESLSIPKQPVQGGVGGNPFIWVQLADAQGNPVTGAILAGRCVQGITTIAADFILPATVFAGFTAEGCYNNPGPYITLSGRLALTGLNARVLFSNNDNPVGGPHQNEQVTSVDVVLIPEGESIQIPKQPVLGGVGGNPWISALFRSASGDPISDEFLLGRCVQLSK